MKYILTKKEANDLGYVLSEKPTTETIEFREDGDIVQSRLISAWMDTSPEILAAWKAKKEMKCERCDHHWTSILATGRPRRCPVCHSPYWDRPRRNRPTVNIVPMIIEVDGKTYRAEWVCEPCGIAWPKDTRVLNVDCPRCRRKCGATSRRVEVQDTPTVSDELMSTEEFQDVWKKLEEGC